MGKRIKFKRRYVLAEGYPWAFGNGPPYAGIGVCSEPKGTSFITFPIPAELWSEDLPRYRLVLERIKEPKGDSLHDPR